MKYPSFVLVPLLFSSLLFATDDCVGAIDVDQDGFYDCNGSPSTESNPCDCDDADPLTYPDAEEVSDAVDNDCDGSLEWVRSYGGTCCAALRDVATVNSGGYVAVGETNSDILIRMDSAGDVVWETTVFQETHASAADVLQLLNGHFVVAGWVETEQRDAVVVGFSPEGERQWTVRVDEGSTESFTAVEQTVDGGLILVGRFQNDSVHEILLVKVNSSRELDWVQKLEGRNPTSIHQVEDGGYIIAASKLVKIDESGNVEWVNHYAGNVQFSEPLDAGGYILCGSHQQRMWLAQTDSLGTMIWEQTYRGEADASDDGCREVHQTPDDGYILAGQVQMNYPEHNAMALKVDSSGLEQWRGIYSIAGGSATAFAIAQDEDGGYILGGTSEVEWGVFHAVLFKTDSEGNTAYPETY